MKSKLALMTLAVVATLAMLSSPTAGAEAKPTQTENQNVVTVEAGDTLAKIAERNNTTYIRIFNANSGIAHPDRINAGQTITIPNQNDQLPDRFSQLVPVAAPVVVTAAPVTPAPVVAAQPAQQYTSAPVNSTSYYVGNGMWCTDYVHSKRPDVAIYGNAGYNWIGAAQAAGKSTGQSPQAGAVAVTNGHVAYVESTNPDGSYVVSEMGWNYQPGNYNKRTVQPGEFGSFIY